MGHKGPIGYPETADAQREKGRPIMLRWHTLSFFLNRFWSGYFQHRFPGKSLFCPVFSTSERYLNLSIAVTGHWRNQAEYY